MSTPTNSGSTKAKSAQKKFGDRFAVDCALLQERTKGIKKKDPKKKKVAKVDLKNNMSPDNMKTENKTDKKENKDVKTEDLEHQIKIFKAKIERLEEQKLFDQITITELKDKVNDMEKEDSGKRTHEFPVIRVVRKKIDEDGDPDMEEFRMPPQIFKEMPEKWQSFVKQEIAKGKKTAHMHCNDLGEHFETMMRLDEDDDVSDEDIEKALMTFDKMWDYGEEDEKGERDYAYKEDNWVDGFDVTIFVNGED